MPKYIVSGLDDCGHKIIEEIEAPTTLVAVQTFRDRGYANVSLETDDLHAALRDLYAKTRLGKAALDCLTPEDWVAQKETGRFQRFCFWYRKLLRQPLVSCTFGLIYFTVRRLCGAPIDYWDLAPFVVLLFPIPTAFQAVTSRSTRELRRLREDFRWNRWNNVLTRLNKLKKKIPPFAFAYMRATALAGLGRLTESLSLLETYADGKQIPEWMYWDCVATLYFTFGDAEKGVGSLKKAIEVAPDNPELQIRLENAEIRFNRDLPS